MTKSNKEGKKKSSLLLSAAFSLSLVGVAVISAAHFLEKGPDP